MVRHGCVLDSLRLAWQVKRHFRCMNLCRHGRRRRGFLWTYGTQTVLTVCRLGLRGLCRRGCCGCFCSLSVVRPLGPLGALAEEVQLPVLHLVTVLTVLA